MPAPRFRSTSYRRVQRRVPGGRSVTHYLHRKPQPAHCAGCGKVLPGIPRERPYKMRNMALSLKRPSRPFGGTLCSSCMRKEMVSRARSSP